MVVQAMQERLEGAEADRDRLVGRVWVGGFVVRVHLAELTNRYLRCIQTPTIQTGGGPAGERGAGWGAGGRAGEVPYVDLLAG